MQLDADSPVPLYHQIAEALRYRIATGRLQPGEALPPVRKAAELWGVNLHTVRRAYRDLAELNLVEVRGARGTRVAPGVAGGVGGGRALGDDLEGFLHRTVTEARARFDLAPADLGRMLADGGPSAERPPRASVVECSDEQCADHAAELEAAWQVEALPWCLSRDGEPPAGTIVATYFHHNEVRARWPHRLDDVRFVAIHPDPQLPRRVRQALGVPDGRGRPTLVLCELDRVQATNIAADLAQLFPAAEYRLETRVAERPAALVGDASPQRPRLVTPRVWGALDGELRQRLGVFLVSYRIRHGDLEALGSELGWRRRRP